jgi:hypothetical protein
LVGPALITPTSADSAKVVTTEITGGLVLFAALVSNVAELTLAVLVMEPLAGDFTVNIRLLTWPEFSVPNAQLTTPPLLTPPPDALTNVTLAGNVSVTTTLLAADGPRLVTEMV